MFLYCLIEQGQLELGPCKIGVAASPAKRLSSLQGGNWRRLEFAWFIPIEDKVRALDVEQYVLSRLRPSIYGPSSSNKLCSEWVDSTPARAMEIARQLLDAIEADRVAA